MVVYDPDLGFAAALLALGYDMVPELLPGEDSHQKLFGFRMENLDIGALKVLYRKGELQVDAKRYAESMRRLKKMLLDAKVVPAGA